MKKIEFNQDLSTESVEPQGQGDYEIPAVDKS